MKIQLYLAMVLAVTYGCKSSSPYGTNLHEAASQGNLSEIEELVEDEEDIDIRGANGWTPLMLAALEGHEKIVRLLISKGADVNAISADRCSVLKYAIPDNIPAYNHKKYNQVMNIVRELVQSGADINYRGGGGISAQFDPAMITAVKCSNDMTLAKYLIENGADINISDKNGYKVLDIVEQKGLKNMAEFIIQRGAINSDKYILERKRKQAEQRKKEKERIAKLREKGAIVTPETAYIDSTKKHYVGTTVIAETPAQSINIQYVSPYNVKKRMIDRMKLEMSSPEDIQRMEKYWPNDCMIKIYIKRLTIGSANTDSFIYVAKQGEREIFREHGGYDIPEYDDFYDCWENTDYISMREPTGPFDFYVIDKVSKKRYKFHIEPIKLPEPTREKAKTDSAKPKPLTMIIRQRIFKALVAEEDRGASDAKAYRIIAKRYGITEKQAEEIADEGIHKMWTTD